MVVSDKYPLLITFILYISFGRYVYILSFKFYLDVSLPGDLLPIDWGYQGERNSL